MISDILRIRQHRSAKQARESSRLETSLLSLQREVPRAETKLSEFVAHKSHQEQVLFRELSEQPASLERIEAFNHTVAQLNEQAQALSDEVARLTAEVAQAEIELAEAIATLHTFRSREQKFEKVVDRACADQRRQDDKLAQALAEELAGDLFLSRGGQIQ